MAPESSVAHWCFITAVLLFISYGISATDLCLEDSSWYDANDGKCRPCKTCGTKALELAPCSEYKDTMCVDLAVFRFDFKSKSEQKLSENPAKWHEMEGDDQTIAERLEQAEKPTSVSKSAFGRFQQEEWGIAIIVVLSITLFAVLGAVAIMVLRSAGRLGNRSENRKVAARARLFSRDRLNTTEYMHNLATLDRRLAMDEILEKRKKAIFEPQLLNENLYTDEVFVDISGIPRHYDDDNQADESDHSRSLLRIQDHHQ